MCRTAKLNSKLSLSHLQQLILDQTQTNARIEHLEVGCTCIKSNRSVYAPHLVQSVRLHLFKYRGGDNAQWISKNKMAAMAVQWELCGANFRENLWVSCYNGINDRSARVLFVQHPREQGEWLRQNPSVRSGYDCIIRPAPSGAGRTTPLQPGHYPLIKAWYSIIFTLKSET